VKSKRGVPSGSPRFTRRSILGGMTAGALAPAVLRAAKPGSAARVTVIGAGVFGAWTAEHLRRAGHHVNLIDMAGPANNRASSGGESRMTRAGYGRDAIYSKMAFASLKEWKALSSVSGLPIFIPHGVLFFTATPDDYFTQSLAVNRSLGLSIADMNRTQLQQRFPMIDFADIELGMFEPEFGALMARRAVQTLVKRFVEAGGLYQQAAVAPPVAVGGKLAQLRMVSGAFLSNGKRRSRNAMISSSAALVGWRDCVSGSTSTPCASWANLTPRPSRSGKP
jgi:hypothetical protein